MIELLKLGITDTPLFQGQVFTFKPGISYIYGLNHSGRTKDANGNAAGKSAFFSRIGELIYDEPIVGTKQDKVKKGKSFFEYRYQGHTVKIMSSFKGRTENFTIWIDGKQSKYNTATKARPALRKLFPPTKEDFDSYIYLDSRVPHPLARGTSIQRKQFFTSFFGLDKIDAERKLFAVELAKLSRVRAAFNELNKTYLSVKQDLLDRETLIELKARHEKLTRIHAKLSKLSDRAQIVKQLLDFTDRAKDQVAFVTAACHGEVTQEAFLEALKDAEWNVKNDAADLEQAQAWEAYQEDLAEYNKAIAALGDNVGSAADYKADSLKYEKALPSYRSLKQQLDDMEEPVKLLHPSKPSDTDIDSLRVKRAQLKSQLDHAHEFEGGKCDTCGQKVTIKNPKALKASLAEVVALIEENEYYAKYVAAKKSNAVLVAKRESLQEKIDALKVVLQETQKAYKLYAQLKHLTKPAKFEGKKIESKVKLRMLDESKERVTLLKYCHPHIDSIIEAQALTEDDLKLREFNSPRLLEIQDELSEIRAKLAVHRSVRSKAFDMKTRLDAMALELKEEEALKLLVKGYSDKAMKRMAIEAISARLMQQINHYAHLVFPGYTFEFRWDTQISILVHRPNGETSDVRKLSGAESTLFTLILIPSLLAFTPERKRVSAIILDEPSASLSEVTIQAFHELLPLINKLIPCIVVITPKADERLASAKNYTVLRKKTGATIVEGHPSELI